ncbi:MAG TPA: SRPBCC family protein [Bryobacteraceae bacterium]
MKKDAIACFVAGAGLMYFADPDRGRRRRAAVRDRFAAGWHDFTNELDKAERDLSNRSHGVGAAVSSIWRKDNADEPVILGRVRTAIGRAVSHPHAIHARSQGEGQIVLEGPVLRHEVDYLLKRVRAVPGVRDVVERLEVHDDSQGISSLQGGVPRRAVSEFAQQNWTPSLRVVSAGFAGTMLAAGSRMDSPARWISITGGAMLLARAICNKPFAQIFGAKGGAGVVNLEKTIHINAPLETVYSFWANFENFPKFMTHLKEVRNLENGRSHWVAPGPGGISIAWDAQITEQQTNQLLGWRSVPGSVVRTAGVVHFDQEPDGRTRVQVRMSYCPPAGLVGHAVAWLFGADPKTEMDEDLVRLKSLLETGKTRAHRVAVTREQVAGAPAEKPQHAW